LSAEEYKQAEESTNAAPHHLAPKPLSRLLTTPHTEFPADNLPEDLTGEELPGYYTPNHEEEHILALDAKLADGDANLHDKSGKPLTISDKNIFNDKELSFRNPVSAYNWLRKYQPQVFLQDKPDQENASEKSAARAGPGRKKSRAEAAHKEPKADHDADDDTFVEFGSSRSKRTNKEDEAYRPKGGSRGAKRKREEGDTPSGSRKRVQKGSRTSGASKADA
jgi:hypothetical protein